MARKVWEVEEKTGNCTAMQIRESSILDWNFGNSSLASSFVP